MPFWGSLHCWDYQGTPTRLNHGMLTRSLMLPAQMRDALATRFDGLENSCAGWLPGGPAPAPSKGQALAPPRPQPRIMACGPHPPLDWSLKTGARFCSRAPFAVAEAARCAPTRTGAPRLLLHVRMGSGSQQYIVLCTFA